MGKREAFVALAELLGDKRAGAEAVKALEDPKAYFDAHKKRLDDRHIDKPGPSLPRVAMVDALLRSKRMASTDWKTDFETLRHHLRALVTTNWAWAANDLELARRPAEELLELIGAHLRKQKLTLMHLDISSDSYQLVVVRNARAVATLAMKAGFAEVIAFTGKRLAALEKKRRAAEQRAANRDPSRQTQFIHADGKRCRAIWQERKLLMVYTKKVGAKDNYNPPNLIVHACATATQLKATREREIKRAERDGFTWVTRDDYNARR